MICDGDFTETAYNLEMGNNCGFPNEWPWTQLKTNSLKDSTPAMVFPHLWWLSSYLWATLGYLLITTMAATAAAQQVNIFTAHLWTPETMYNCAKLKHMYMDHIGNNITWDHSVNVWQHQRTGDMPPGQYTSTKYMTWIIKNLKNSQVMMIWSLWQYHHVAI